MSKILTTLYCLIFFYCVSIAQSGELDPSFATDGILLMDLGGGTDTPHDIVVQPDGKILVGGVGTIGDFNFALIRLLEDGTPDSTFADNGVYHYNNTNGSDLLYDIELLDDGSILLAGSYRHPNSSPPANSDFFINKLTPDGVLDPTFGTDGIIIQEIDLGLDYARGIIVTENDQIAVCGYSHVPDAFDKRNVVLLYNADGTLDTDFGTDGIFLWNDIGISTEMYSIALAPDGNFLVAGYANPGGANRVAIYKVLADGSGLDPTFGTNGEILAPIEGAGRNIQVHSNGNILVAGYAANPVSGNDFAVLAYHPDGTPNTDFGVEGIFKVDVYTQDYGNGMVIQSDGKILVVGESGDGPFGGNPSRFVTVRCDAEGVLDSSWGGTGIVETVTSTIFAFPHGITIQPSDGKVLIAGATASTGGNDFTVVRYGNYIDADGDGSPLGEDCNDANAAIFPGNDETPYNSIDDDCDPATPDDDLDNDGFLLADDCDDMNPGINPDAEDIPDNGIDEDCDGMDVITTVYDVVLSQQFSVFPNPATDWLNLHYEATALQPSEVIITDVMGRKLRAIQENLEGGNIPISLSDFPSGVLILIITTEKGIVMKRVVSE